MGSRFFPILFYFLRTPLHGLAVCGLIYLVYLFFLYLSLTQLDFSETCISFSLPYAYSTSTAIFRLILLRNITPQRTLHSSVKDSITHNSTVIWSSNLMEDLYVNATFASTFL